MGKSLSLVENCRRSLHVVGLEKVEEAHVLMPPLMCWYLGRQGSSAKGSWEKTESSPEEQELRVSGKLGEYCSIGAHRSRYSYKHKDEAVSINMTRTRAATFTREKLYFN